MSHYDDLAAQYPFPYERGYEHKVRCIVDLLSILTNTRYDFLAVHNDIQAYNINVWELHRVLENKARSGHLDAISGIVEQAA